MRNTGFTITVPSLFSPLSAFSAASRSYIITFRFNIHETLQYFKISRVLIQTANPTKFVAYFKIYDTGRRKKIM